jgi:hypothetical protein
MSMTGTASLRESESWPFGRRLRAGRQAERLVLGTSGSRRYTTRTNAL